MSARDVILERDRARRSGGAAPPAASPRGYRTAGARPGRARRALLRAGRRVPGARCAESPADVARRGRRRCARGRARLVVPPGLPAAWRPAGVELVDDDGR